MHVINSIVLNIFGTKRVELLGSIYAPYDFLYSESLCKCPVLTDICPLYSSQQRNSMKIFLIHPHPAETLREILDRQVFETLFL